VAKFAISHEEFEFATAELEPGDLFFTPVTIQRWGFHPGRKDKTHVIMGLMNGPFHFIFLEVMDAQFVRVLTPWGVCFIDYYDFRDHCEAVLKADGSEA
jgi:hypothetical protein